MRFVLFSYLCVSSSSPVIVRACVRARARACVPVFSFPFRTLTLAVSPVLLLVSLSFVTKRKINKKEKKPFD